MKKLMLIAVLILAAVIVFVVVDKKDDVKDDAGLVNTPSNNNTIPDGYMVYTNEPVGFSILRPSGSTVAEEGEGRIKIMYLGPKNDIGTEIQDGFTLTIYKESLATSTTLQALAEMKAQGETVNGGRILTNPESVEVNGMSAYRYSYENLLGSTSWSYVFLPQANTAYTATYTIADPDNKNYASVVSNMLESLVLNR